MCVMDCRQVQGVSDLMPCPPGSPPLLYRCPGVTRVFTLPRPFWSVESAASITGVKHFDTGVVVTLAALIANSLYDTKVTIKRC